MAELALTEGTGSAPEGAASPELAVIVPTFNESGNVQALIDKLEAALEGIAWEVIFVDDDSRDGTLDELLALGRRDSRVRFIQRIGRRGLSSAVVEGMLATSAPYLAVVDGDLQHDETRLPPMLQLLREQACDIVIGTRYDGGGGVGDWAKSRQLISRAATKLAQLVLPVPISDPMSGFFALTRDAFHRSVRNLSKQGYKILLDIVLSSREPPRIREVPYTFRNRAVGDSKLDSSAIADYLALLLDKSVGHLIPVRFIMFGAVGGAGVLVHMSVLAASLAMLLPFLVAQTLATFVAMTFNFFVNNVLTYRDKRLKGPGAVLRGLATFYLVCSVGAVSNIGIASVMFNRQYSWWLAAMAGILVGVVWNYTMTSTFTWRTQSS